VKSGKPADYGRAAEGDGVKSGKKADITNQEVGPVTADVYFTCTAK
jgi:hypothetical protein